jgi:ABC-type transport system substrate-binding protein
MKTRKAFAVLSILIVLAFVLSACATQPVAEPQTVVQTVEVVKTVEVEKEVVTTEVVEVEKASFTTPHPILGDLRVRQAIAYCTNRPELIASVYPWLPEDQRANLMMYTNIPRISWAAYYGDEVEKYDFDAAKGAALLDEAGWTLPEGDTQRYNAAGDPLTLKFTTTSAEFRKTWGAVFTAQMAACGIQILPLYTPGSWWFGSNSGLRHRDFELGAYAWVGESDPKGQTLYACNQIPLPTNGWAGQNYMGWCNQTASDAINAANNTLVREDRKAQYKTFQIEYAKDMVSLPVFQRAEGNAATKALVNFKPSATEYYSWNAYEWERTDGGDTLVLALSQEPSSMWSIIESSAVERTVAWLVYDYGSLGAASQVDYDFQERLFKLSTVESGLAVVNEVEAKEGDPVVDYSGTPTDADGNLLTLKAGLKVKQSDGTDVDFASGTVKMNQLVVTYQTQDGLKWSDGTPVEKADFELAYKIDCDPAIGAVDYSTCQSIQKVDFTSDKEYVITYKPGYMNSLSFLAPIGMYPAHQVLSDGRKLADVPSTEWGSLPEVAETPMGVGAYVIKNWEKGVKMELEENPYYYKGPLKIKKIVVIFVPDTQQAVAQLLTGDVDVVGSETLGAGPEVQTVLDNQDKLQVLVEPSATWEHIDMNLFIP